MTTKLLALQIPNRNPKRSLVCYSRFTTLPSATSLSWSNVNFLCLANGNWFARGRWFEAFAVSY
ncbi:MAG: hypothetical protein LBI18_06160 [Planctomycetaceae bacterium]|nr:hypothetical protein [Planctomycetaceae bacterium]